MKYKNLEREACGTIGKLSLLRLAVLALIDIARSLSIISGHMMDRR